MTKIRKILIIGGNGFIGGNLARHLAKRSDLKIYTLDVTKQKKSKTDGITGIEGDFFDDDALRRALKGMDLVIHAMGTINPGNSNETYMHGYSRDFLQTVTLCDMLMRQETGMIFISSGGAIYGDVKCQPINESEMPAPISHYGCMKLCCENVIRTFNRQFHRKMRIARISNPFGPGQDYDKGVGFVDAAVKKAILQEPLEIWGDGENIRDYIYIEDVSRMLEALIDYEGEEELFHISSGRGLSQNQVLKILADMDKSVETVYNEPRSVDVRRVILDNARIRKVYRGDILRFEDGVQRYCRYLQGNKEELGQIQKKKELL